MKRKIIAGICAIVITVCLAVPVSAAGCNEPAQTSSGCWGINIEALFSCNDKISTSTGDNLRNLLNGYLNAWISNGGTKIPEIPIEPETPTSPEPPIIVEPPKEIPSSPEKEPEVPSVPEEKGSSCNEYAQDVLDLVNDQRAANGLSALTLNSDLCAVAQEKARDMHDQGYFDHNSPTYGTPFDMMRSFGITYSAAGENIAMGYQTASAVVNAWMNSSGHRANILNSSFTQMAIGYVESGNYWCQMFIG